MTDLCGSRATGIRRRVITTGTEAIGRARHMLARSGSYRTTQKAATTVAIGTVRMGALSMTITGTMTTIGITAAGTKTTASTKAGTKRLITTTTTTTATRPRINFGPRTRQSVKLSVQMSANCVQR